MDKSVDMYFLKGSTHKAVVYLTRGILAHNTMYMRTWITHRAVLM